MKVTQTLLSLTKILSENSNHQNKIGAVIFKGKKILSIGFNQVNRHTSKIHPSMLKWEGSLHAEQAAIISAKCNLKGTNILVVRYDKNGNMQMAKPCEYCHQLIENVGIKKVYYSDECGNINLYKTK